MSAQLMATTAAAEAGAARASRRPRWLAWFENGLIGLLGVALAIAAVAVLTGNWQVQPVLSGSMRPALQPGSVIIVQREPVSELKVGDILVFHQPDAPSIVIAHRVIKATPAAGGVEVTTKGDANSVADPWGQFLVREPYAFTVRAAVPGVGFAAVFVRRYAFTLALFAGAALLVYGIVRQLRKPASATRP